MEKLLGFGPESSPQLLLVLPHSLSVATSVILPLRALRQFLGAWDNRKPLKAGTLSGGQLTDRLEVAQSVTVLVQLGTWPGSL